MSIDDPDTWLRNAEQFAVAPVNAELFFHHPFHAREIREQANTIGLTNVS
jgi:hypothetical protein